MPSSPLPRWILNVSGATVIGFNGEEEIKVGANQRRLNCQLPKMKEARRVGWRARRHGVRLRQWRALCRGRKGRGSCRSEHGR